MKYAMILKSRVIDIKESNEKPQYPPDKYGNKVMAVEFSDDISVGMIYNAETESFSEYMPPEPEPPQPTQLDRIESLLVQSVTDIENNAIDRYNLELVKEGVL